MARFLAATLILLSACSNSSDIEDYIDLVVENRTGAQLWYFSYVDCGSDGFTGVIASDEYVADGSDVTAFDLDPGCYDLYVEDEFGCFTENSTDGNVEGGMAFIWTVTENDLTCP